jgi:transposase
VTPELWAEIQRLFQVEKRSKRAIARELRLADSTVRRALARAGCAPLPQPARGSHVDPFVQRIEDLLARYPDLSAVRILEEIKRHGYKGGYTVLKERLRQLRPRTKEAFTPLRFEPGEAAQVDWASCGTLKIGDTVRRLSCFVMVLCHSRMLYLEFTISESLADFLRCHVNAFNFFDGIPKRIVYDNLRSVVVARHGTAIRFQQRFLALAGHYLFKPVLCQPRRPNEKGRVENAIGYMRKSFLAGRDLHSLVEYDTASVRWRDETCNVRLHATTKRRPVDLFAEEKPFLISLPGTPFDTDAIETPKVSPLAFVSFDGNRYSVPSRLAGATATLRASAHTVVVVHDGAEVARHARCHERGREIDVAEHRRELIEQKRRATDSAETTRFLALGPEAEPYLRGLVAGEHDHHRQVRRVLALVDSYGEIEVLGAIVKALEYRAFGADYLERIVSQERRRRAETEPTGPVRVTTPGFADIRIRSADLAEYDRLFGASTEKEITPHADAHASDPTERREEPDRPRP